MKYIIRFFTHINKEEKFIKKYIFESLPYIPPLNSLISIDDEQYKIKQICTCYDEPNEQYYEIMLDYVDYNYEWWE